jgi:hypothetical protein
MKKTALVAQLIMAAAHKKKSRKKEEPEMTKLSSPSALAIAALIAEAYSRR